MTDSEYRERVRIKYKKYSIVVLEDAPVSKATFGAYVLSTNAWVFMAEKEYPTI